MALLLAAETALSGPAPQATGDGELLQPGPAREVSIAGGEVQLWRLPAAEEPLLVIVEQRGIDLVVEARDAAGGGVTQVDSPTGRWGPETLLIPTQPAAGLRIEVRPFELGRRRRAMQSRSSRWQAPNAWRRPRR